MKTLTVTELEQVIAGLRFENERLRELNVGWRIRCESMEHSGEIAKLQLECNQKFIDEQNRLIFGLGDKLKKATSKKSKARKK